MKRFHKYIALLLSVMLLASVCNFSAAATNEAAIDGFTYKQLETDPSVLQVNTSSAAALPYSSISNSVVNDKMHLANAENAYDNLMTSFYQAQTNTEPNVGHYTVNGIGADEFPDTYAGAYINKDLDLVVLMTEDKITDTQSIYTAQQELASASDSDEIIFAAAEYSYSYLVSLMDDIYQYLLTGSNGNDGFYIVTYALDDFENRIIVGLSDISPENVEAFKETVSDSAAIEFEQTEIIYSQSYTTESARDNASELESEKADILRGPWDTKYISPGQALETGSVGFRAFYYDYDKHKNIYGFITAAHCYQPSEAVYSPEPHTIYGTASEELWQYSGNLDAVFIELYERREVTQTIENTGGEQLKAGIDIKLARGNPIGKSGKTTGYTTGTVESVSSGFEWDGISYYDFGVANYTFGKGDSGGIVFGTRTGYNYIAGIHEGGYEFLSSSETYPFYCKAENITTSFDLSLY